MVVIEFRAWERWLLPLLVPDAHLIRLAVDDTVDSLFSRILALSPAPSDVMFHVNLTEPGRMPRNRPELLDRLEAAGYRCWNGRVASIAKRELQKRNLEAGLPSTALGPGHPEDRVMVKSNLNAFGRVERALSEAERLAYGLPDYQSLPAFEDGDYPVMCRKDVPAEWWSNDDLFIERYIDTRSGEFFRVQFVGERVVIFTGRSSQPVKRLKVASDRRNYLVTTEFASGPKSLKLPEELRAVLSTAVTVAKASRLDYGSIDLNVDDEGRVFAIDVNATPHWGGEIDPVLRNHMQAGLREAAGPS